MSQSAIPHRTANRTTRHSTPFGYGTADSTLQGPSGEAVFHPDPQRVGEIRHAAASFLHRSGVAGPVVDDAVLAVSELVTNAIQHGDGEVRVRISMAGGELRVSVTDRSPEPAEVRHAGIDDVSGRGLFLVTAFARSWGSSGEETWCTFRYPMADGGTVTP